MDVIGKYLNSLSLIGSVDSVICEAYGCDEELIAISVEAKLVSTDVEFVDNRKSLSIEIISCVFLIFF